MFTWALKDPAYLLYPSETGLKKNISFLLRESLNVWKCSVARMSSASIVTNDEYGVDAAIQFLKLLFHQSWLLWFLLTEHKLVEPYRNVHVFVK